MGKDKRSGFGYGMTEFDAQRDFEKSLNHQYGHNRGSQDITRYIKSKCIEKPVQKQSANKVKVKSINQDKQLKLVNGFLITNEVTTNIRKHLLKGLDYGEFSINEKVALTLKEAKDIASKISLSNNEIYHIIPTKVIQNINTKEIKKANPTFEVTPENAKEEKQGKWSFEVEVRN